MTKNRVKLEGKGVKSEWQDLKRIDKVLIPFFGPKMSFSETWKSLTHRHLGQEPF